MVSFACLSSLLLAAALPSARAWNYPPPVDFCDDYTVEIYRKDLPDRAKLLASASAYAYGDNTWTSTNQWLVQSSGQNQYYAYLTGYSDNGAVVLYNSGNGKAIDCDKIWELEYVEVDGKDCCYEVDWRVRKACDKAVNHWDGFAYVEGGDAYISVDVLQDTGYSATSQYLYAYGKYISAELNQSDTVKQTNGSVNTAEAHVSANTQGSNSQVNGSTYTRADQNSSESSSTLDARSNRRLMF